MGDFFFKVWLHTFLFLCCLGLILLGLWKCVIWDPGLGEPFTKHLKIVKKQRVSFLSEPVVIKGPERTQEVRQYLSTGIVILSSVPHTSQQG